MIHLSEFTNPTYLRKQNRRIREQMLRDPALSCVLFPIFFPLFWYLFACVHILKSLPVISFPDKLLERVVKAQGLGLPPSCYSASAFCPLTLCSLEHKVCINPLGTKANGHAQSLVFEHAQRLFESVSSPMFPSQIADVSLISFKPPFPVNIGFPSFSFLSFLHVLLTLHTALRCRIN